MIRTDEVKKFIRDIPDFPKSGILFRDITPVLSNPKVFRMVIDWFTEECKNLKAEKLIAIESRGFFLAAPVADRLGIGLVLARKKGKLPYKTVTHSYDLEYGSAELQMHVDSINEGERVVIVDDLIATGGTVRATAGLCKMVNANPVGIVTLIELDFLKGREQIGPLELRSMIHY